MGIKKRDRKTKIVFQKKLLASVTEEMAQPRMSKSASIETDKQNHARNAKPDPLHAR